MIDGGNDQSSMEDGQKDPPSNNKAKIDDKDRSWPHNYDTCILTYQRGGKKRHLIFSPKSMLQSLHVCVLLCVTKYIFYTSFYIRLVSKMSVL